LPPLVDYFSAMTAVLRAPVAALKERYDELSGAHKLLLAEVIQNEKATAEADGIEWPWDVVDERQKAMEKGRSELIPSQEFKRMILERPGKQA
jgi:hypothetical protein